jgi:hypothetical protein
MRSDGSQKLISGNEYNADETYWLIATYKKWSDECRISVVTTADKHPAETFTDCDHIWLSVFQAIKEGYTGDIVVNEIGSRGVYVVDMTRKSKERVPCDISDDYKNDPEYIIVPRLVP